MASARWALEIHVFWPSTSQPPSGCRADVRAGRRFRHGDGQHRPAHGPAEHPPPLLLGAEPLVRLGGDDRRDEAARGDQAVGGLLQEDAGVGEAAARAAVLLRQADPEPAQVGEPAVEPLVVRFAPAVGQRVPLLPGPALAFGEVPHGGGEIGLVLGETTSHDTPSWTAPDPSDTS
jgi:hypothetical protein